jgi:hypothetical protein
MICDSQHPDCISNHWLMVFVAEQLAGGGSILHNDRYYWPIGDAPVLAGNGGEGFVYLVFHQIFGWPTGAVAHLFCTLVFGGMSIWLLARVAGVGRWAALVPAAAISTAPYIVGELDAGRFSQVNTGWMWLTLAAGLMLLQKPSAKTATALGLSGAITCFFYWYYGWFAFVALCLIGGAFWVLGARMPWKHIGLAAAVGAIAIAPWAWLFTSGWGAIPGTDEAFPPAMALLDSTFPSLPFQLDRDIGTIALLPWVLGLAGAIAACRPGARPLPRALLLVWLCFTLLAMGPAFTGAPYTWLYGLAAPLKRFWWPLRHTIVATGMWSILAALALDRILKPRFKPIGLLVALSTPIFLSWQGAITHPRVTRLQWPAPGYEQLRDAPKGVVVEPPLNPAVTGTQQHLLSQLTHKKPMLTGHAMWVDRVRPPAWDNFMESSPLLHGLQQMELGHLGPTLRFDDAEIGRLSSQGVRWFVLNRSAFPLRLKPVVQAYRHVFTTLFGPPIHATSHLQVWDATRWTGITEVAIPALVWPSQITPAGPTQPLTAKRPMDPVFVVGRR